MLKLTPASRAELRFYVRYRDQPVTVLGLLVANLKVYCFLVAAFALLEAIAYLFVDPIFAAFMGGMFVAVVARDIGRFRKVKRVWPVICSVIDWQQVEQLLLNDKISQVNSGVSRS